MSEKLYKCFSEGCHNKVQRGGEWNNWDLWCYACHMKTHKPKTFADKQRAFQKRVFADGRAGKIEG